MNMWSQAAKVDKDTFTVKVTNLFEGQNYLFRVAAENQCGRGAFVELTKPVTAKLPFGKSFLSILFRLQDTCCNSRILESVVVIISFEKQQVVFNKYLKFKHLVLTYTH